MTKKTRSTYYEETPIPKVIDNVPRDMKTILILGEMPDGELYAASNTGRMRRVVELVEAFIKKVNSNAYDTTDIPPPE
jgi:hypothetical protein